MMTMVYPRFDIMDKIPCKLRYAQKGYRKSSQSERGKSNCARPLTKLLASKTMRNKLLGWIGEENMVRDYGVILLNVLHTRKTASDRQLIVAEQSIMRKTFEGLAQ